MSTNRNQQQRTHILWWILLIVGLGLLVRMSSQLWEVVRLSGRVEESFEEVAQLEEKQRQMEKELILHSSEEYVERQIREQLALGKEGEVVLLLPVDIDELSRILEEEYEQEEILIQPYWRQWLELVF